MTVMFGISNCDTIRKAKKWLSDNDIPFDFHDFRKQGIEEAWLKEAVNALGWETLLNKRGTTFRQLDEEQKSNIDTTKAISLMLEHPAMIKRPVLFHQNTFTCGFNDKVYSEIFK
jgi:Spx/MgsR family transcriptional regulator